MDGLQKYRRSKKPTLWPKTKNTIRHCDISNFLLSFMDLEALFFIKENCKFFVSKAENICFFQLKNTKNPHVKKNTFCNSNSFKFNEITK